MHDDREDCFVSYYVGYMIAKNEIDKAINKGNVNVLPSSKVYKSKSLGAWVIVGYLDCYKGFYSFIIC